MKRLPRLSEVFGSDYRGSLNTGYCDSCDPMSFIIPLADSLVDMELNYRWSIGNSILARFRNLHTQTTMETLNNE